MASFKFIPEVAPAANGAVMRSAMARVRWLAPAITWSAQFANEGRWLPLPVRCLPLRMCALLVKGALKNLPD